MDIIPSSTMTIMEEEEICGLYEGYSTQRFIIITGCTTVALFGVLANMVKEPLVDPNNDISISVVDGSFPSIPPFFYISSYTCHV
uniref:Transmembrane protein n=1 Tax=Caenorhabditis tropicalis TaxID=1561998 RepID=A0A1I7T133_9PELO